MFLLSRFLFVSLAWYARCPLWDFEVLHACLLAEPDGPENGVDHGLEHGPTIKWGHDESIHGRSEITVSTTLFYEMVL